MSSKAPEVCGYCDGEGNSRAGGECGFCEKGKPLDTQEDWDRSWGRILDINVNDDVAVLTAQARQGWERYNHIAQEYATLKELKDRLIVRVLGAEDLLRSLEWSGELDSCPVCHALRGWHQHEQDCPIGRLVHPRV